MHNGKFENSFNQIRAIRKGSYGHVFEARDNLSFTYAIKEIKIRFIRQNEFIRV